MDELRTQVAQLRAKYLPVNHAQVPKKAWYRIENAASDERAVIYIYDEIHWLFGISADQFLDELNAITAPVIELHLNSPGGDVFDGLAIFTSLIQHPAKVEVVVDALAASIASIIAMAGDERMIAPQGMMMIHDASGATFGPAGLHREMADLLDKVSDNLASAYSDRAGGDTAAWREAMLATTWYTAAEAVEAGLMDKVGTPTAADDDTEESDLAAAFVNTVFRYDAESPVNGHDPIPEPDPVSSEPERAFDPAAFRAALMEVMQ